LRRAESTKDAGDVQRHIASGEPQITLDKIGKVPVLLRDKLRHGPLSFAKPISVSNEEIRISGSKSVLARCAAAGEMPSAPAVLSFVQEWRAVARSARALRQLEERSHTVLALVEERRLGESFQSIGGRSGQRIRHDRRRHRSRASAQRRRTQKGGLDQAVGRSRGGLSTKIHVIVDALGNPLALNLTSGQVHDISQAETLIAEVNRAPSSVTRVMTPTLSSKALRARDQAGHPAEVKSQDQTRVRFRALRRAQPHRALLQFHQTVPRHRDPLRKDRAQFPRRPAPGLRTRLAQMRTRPS
jgi:hypothetical protein